MKLAFFFLEGLASVKVLLGPTWARPTLYNNLRSFTTSSPLSQRKKLRHRDRQAICPRPQARKGQSQDLNPGSLAADSVPLTTMQWCPTWSAAAGGLRKTPTHHCSFNTADHVLTAGSALETSDLEGSPAVPPRSLDTTWPQVMGLSSSRALLPPLRTLPSSAMTVPPLPGSQ